jgi:hypothetical protein
MDEFELKDPWPYGTPNLPSARSGTPRVFNAAVGEPLRRH